MATIAVDGLLMLCDAADLLSEQKEKEKEKLIIDNKKKRPFEQVAGELSWPTMSKKKRTPTKSCLLRERIAERGGEVLRLVMRKKLTKTDVCSNHGRLSMPSRSLRSRFLKDAEESQAADEGIQVAVFDEQFREYTLRLKEWKMGNTRIFNLNGDWNSVVKRNAFAARDGIQLWSFRHHSLLCFALLQL